MPHHHVLLVTLYAAMSSNGESVSLFHFLHGSVIPDTSLQYTLLLTTQNARRFNDQFSVNLVALFSINSEPVHSQVRDRNLSYPLSNHSATSSSVVLCELPLLYKTFHTVHTPKPAQSIILNHQTDWFQSQQSSAIPHAFNKSRP